MGTSATVTVCAVRQSTETTCDDGIDNDCDGLVDSEDPDCGGTGAPSRDPQFDKGAVKSMCGNGVCEKARGESAALCPRDCPAVCGDKFCDKLRKETAKTCPADCPARCGDDYCDAKRGESVRTCSHDCPGSCGDKYCNAARGENPVTCPKDCPSRSVPLAEPVSTTTIMFHLLNLMCFRARHVQAQKPQTGLLHHHIPHCSAVNP
jgi:hypothetical protein